MTPTQIICALAVAGTGLIGSATGAAAAPALASAQAAVVFSSPTTCEVTLTVAISGAATMEHRLEALEGSRTELVEVRGATTAGEVRDVGRTKALTVTPSGTTPYAIHYRYTQTPDKPNRCPIWLPTAPADGRSRNVTIAVELPDQTVASGTMPAFTWQGTHGTATLPHLPAFVIVPYTGAGEARPWDVSRVMDAVALATLVGASGVWLKRRRRA